MATIGTFTKDQRRLHRHDPDRRLRPRSRSPRSRSAAIPLPTIACTSARSRSGGWARTSKGGREFVSLKARRSELPPLRSTELDRARGQHELIWSR